MTEKNIKRGFNFSPQLLAAWEELHAPSKDYTPSAAGAFLLWLVIEPALREQLRKLAFAPDVKKARIEARKALRQTIIDGYWAGFVGKMPVEDRIILLGDAIRSEKKLSDKK